jgi:hypothetical protein
MLDYLSLEANLSDEEWTIREIVSELMHHVSNIKTVNTHQGAYDIHTFIRGQDRTDIAIFE